MTQTHHLVNLNDEFHLACGPLVPRAVTDDDDFWYTHRNFLHQGRRPRNRFCPGCLLTVDPLELLAELNI